MKVMMLMVMMRVSTVYYTTRMLSTGWCWLRLCHHVVISLEITYIIAQDVFAMKIFHWTTKRQL